MKTNVPTYREISLLIKIIAPNEISTIFDLQPHNLLYRLYKSGTLLQLNSVYWAKISSKIKGEENVR